MQKYIIIQSKILNDPDIYDEKLPNIDDYDNLIPTNSPIFLPDASDAGFSLTNISENDKRTTITPSELKSDVCC